MSESARIGMRHRAGSVGALIGQQAPINSRDHRRDNAKSVRSLSRQVTLRRKEAEQAPDPEFKLKQFENIPSRLYQTPKRSAKTPPTTRLGNASAAAQTPIKGSPPTAGAKSPWGKAPLRPCNEASPTKTSRPGSNSGRPQSARPAAKGGEALPARGSPGCRLHFSPAPRGVAAWEEPARSPLGERAASVGPRRLFGEGNERPSSAPDSMANTMPPGWWPGAVDISPLREPSMAKIRGKAPQAKEVRRSPAPFAVQEDPRPNTEVPPGYKLLSEAERLESLSELRGKLKELNNRYSRLPLKIETEGQRQQQKALTEKILETERAESLFSRRTVLVEC
ncbi:unnamed protein product [Polarella glacialis]|uniref:Enkurin domain-containing protein n=1 Tax=Polarella glacialis TaxID=89957 RepID=A0A813HGK3_POLGL|nr:unnamed protein product [Polarella glacialis]